MPIGTGVLDSVKLVLARLLPTMSQWQIAFWFVSAKGWLAGGAPIDLLRDGDWVYA
jgi:hypothetical protein